MALFTAHQSAASPCALEALGTAEVRLEVALPSAARAPRRAAGDASPAGPADGTPGADGPCPAALFAALKQAAAMQAAPEEVVDGWRVRVLPRRGERFEVVVSDDIVRIGSATWRYRLEP